MSRIIGLIHSMSESLYFMFHKLLRFEPRDLRPDISRNNLVPMCNCVIRLHVIFCKQGTLVFFNCWQEGFFLGNEGCSARLGHLSEAYIYNQLWFLSSQNQ